MLLEICPLSNVLTGSVESIEAHPLRRLFDAGIHSRLRFITINHLNIIDASSGVLISINSDDGGMFHSSIIDDYKLVVNHHHFTIEELRQCNLNALDASFLKPEVKEAVRRKYFS